MVQEDKWVDWWGIDPELQFPAIKAYWVVGVFGAGSTQTTSVYSSLIWDAYMGAYADWDALDDHAAIGHLITGFYHLHDYLLTLVAACGTNKWNETMGELTPDLVMEKWLEKAGEVLPP